MKFSLKWNPNGTPSGHSRVAQLTRFPIAARVKTRLIPALGEQGAAALHRALAEHVASEVFALAATEEADMEVWYDSGTTRQMRSWLGPLPRYRQQPSGDLGQRLAFIFDTAFREGVHSCVAVGSDCPAMTADHLRQALMALDKTDVVIGPANDGGYWLIGIRSVAARALPILFQGIEWGSERVFEQSIERAKRHELRVTLLEKLADVDRPEDVCEWTRMRDPLDEAMRISVVIPTLNEQEMIGNAIASAYNGGVSEVIVVDGGSSDSTREVATAAGARVVVTSRGRARQMNFGAARTTGDAMLFLHADTTLPPRTAALVRDALLLPGVVGGAFTYSASGAGRWDTILSVGGRWRCQLSGHPYGDQALFLRARTFRALSGFPDIPVMEDWELVYRLRKLGRVVVLPEPIVTSSASWADYGFAKASLLNLVAIFGYQLGVDPYRLVTWRNRIARRAG